MPAAGQPTCGNGIIEPPEECERPGFICRGGCNAFTHLCVDFLCAPDCTCPDPVCGDLAIDPGEDCDPPGSPCARDCNPFETPCCTPPTPCLGSCDASCHCPLSPPTPTSTAPTGLPTETATPTPPIGCVGDCNGTGSVTVANLVRCVSISLGRQPASSCLSCDPNRSETVTVDELTQAVSNSLNGCP